MKAFVEVFAKEIDDKNELKLKVMTVIEIWDRIQRLTNTKFLSPIGLAQNFFLLKLTGSRLTVDIVGSFDGSGKYDKLKDLEKTSASGREISIKANDCTIVADNEQVMTSNHRLFGQADDHNLVVNVFMNWMVTYFCNPYELCKYGIKKRC